jgi:SET domain-containing protein
VTGGRRDHKSATKSRTKSRIRYNVAPLPDPPRIERRKSKVHGWGVFALETIPKNKRIVDYAGQKISNKDSSPREERYLAKGHIWCFKLNSRWVIDANVRGNVARFINHGCKPNCYSHIVNGVIWIRAARTIRKGEELTYNYNTDGAGEIPCRCRPDCKNQL